MKLLISSAQDAFYNSIKNQQNTETSYMPEAQNQERRARLMPPIFPGLRGIINAAWASAHHTASQVSKDGEQDLRLYTSSSPEVVLENLIFWTTDFLSGTVVK